MWRLACVLALSILAAPLSAQSPYSYRGLKPGMRWSMLNRLLDSLPGDTLVCQSPPSLGLMVCERRCAIYVRDSAMLSISAAVDKSVDKVTALTITRIASNQREALKWMMVLEERWGPADESSPGVCLAFWIRPLWRAEVDCFSESPWDGNAPRKFAITLYDVAAHKRFQSRMKRAALKGIEP